MAIFDRNEVTNAGLTLFARANSGEIKVELTKIVTSSASLDSLSDDDLRALTALTDIEQSKVPDRVFIEINENNTPVVYARAALNNSQVTTAYNIYAYGLYATNPDDTSQEILVAVSANKIGEPPLNMPAMSDIYGIGVTPKFAIPIGRMDSITIVFNPDGAVNQDDLEDLRRQLQNTNFPNDVWINKESTQTVQNGAANYPYISINQALAAYENKSGIRFRIAPGVYNENIVIDGEHNWFFDGAGAIGGAIVAITGSLDISSTSDNLGFDSINFSGQVTNNSAVGNIFIDNCHFDSLTNGTSSAGLCLFDQCSFENDVQIYGNAKITFRLTDFGESGRLYMRNTGPIVEANECSRVALNHLAGRYISSGNTQHKPFAGGNAIASSAQGLGNELVLLSGTTGQTDGTFAGISQLTTDGYYVLANFVHSRADSFRGIRLTAGLLVDDIYDTNTYSSIAPTSGLLKETLRLLDAQIVSSNATLNQILTNTQTILTRVNSIETNVNTLVTNSNRGAVRQIIRYEPTSSSAVTYTPAFANVSKVSYNTNLYATCAVSTYNSGGGVTIGGYAFGPQVQALNSNSVTILAGVAYGVGSSANNRYYYGGVVEFTEYY